MTLKFYPAGYQGALDRSWNEYAQGIADAFDRAVPNANLPRGQGFAAGFSAGYAAGVQREETQKRLAKIPALLRATDPETSFEAAKKAERQAGKLTELVLLHLKGGYFTAGELAEKIGVPRDSISPRLAPLRRRGLIVKVGTYAGQTVYGVEDDTLHESSKQPSAHCSSLATPTTAASSGNRRLAKRQTSI